MSGYSTTSMRVLIGVLIFVVLAIPIALFLLKNPMVSTYVPGLARFSKPAENTKRFSARSDVPGYTLQINGSQYLESVADKLGLFNTNGVITPQSVRENTLAKDRVSVSNVQFVLVSSLDTFITAKLGKVTSGVRPTLWGKADYRVEGDVLVVPISLDFDYLTRDTLVKKYYLEDVLVKIATTFYRLKPLSLAALCSRWC